MLSHATMAISAITYRTLAEDLRSAYAEMDEETLTDTLEGMSDLPDMLRTVVRSSLSDEMLAGALRNRLAEMKSRLERLEARVERKRHLVCDCMGKMSLEKLQAEDFSVSRRIGPNRLEISDETAIPEKFLVPQPPRLDRAGLLATLKRGEQIHGAVLQAGVAHIQVRTK